MNESPALHAGIASLVTLAAAVAARNEELYACHLDRLRKLGVPEAHIETAIEIARHTRDEAVSAFERRLGEDAAATAADDAAPIGCCGSQGCC